ncbi:DASH family cryptochrome [Aquimarina spongiae]|uniref:Cryptochrome DASH n=1 Tax=Aquimarina spongiae TaxID=570521 RepID=A0A1M6IYB6_9FLAO|nr:DASH family cryptochrome [Aquimarina spongiae]SHJ39426.1 deoxyribodipyrimidine photo-lyase (single-stranded DNA-specific) [Aquimarina spongiae]
MSKTGLVWFRNDLRTKDNTSLQKAVPENTNVIGIYFFDPRLFETDRFGFRKTGKFRAKFLLESVSELKENLAQLNIPLFVYRQFPEDVLPQFFEDRDIAAVYLQKEWTQEESDALAAVKSSLKHYTVDWFENYDQFLFHPEDIPFEITDIPKVFTNFRKKCEKYSKVRPEVDIERLPESNMITNDTALPSLFDLGFEAFQPDHRSAFPFKGGENEALQRVTSYFWDTKKLSYYKKTRNGLIGTNYSSKLSAWLANGCISPRTIYHEVKKYEQQIAKNDSTYWLIFELIWRDFFKYISLQYGNAIFWQKGILERSYDWSDNKEAIQKWIDGETFEPFVNANMLELKYTGWMSNRGRQNVASFFAKELELDWRVGAAYFESLLIDYDVHSNYGNWMYVAGVGNDPRDRKFNIKLQAERYDPQQKYQSIWLQPTLF